MKFEIVNLYFASKKHDQNALWIWKAAFKIMKISKTFLGFKKWECLVFLLKKERN